MMLWGVGFIGCSEQEISKFKKKLDVRYVRFPPHGNVLRARGIKCLISTAINFVAAYIFPNSSSGKQAENIQLFHRTDYNMLVDAAT
jgi:hypothetical protein